MKHKTIIQLRDNLKKVLKRGRPKQLKKLQKAYHGKRLNEWWCDYAKADGHFTIAQLKDFEGDKDVWSIDGSAVKYIGCIKRTNFDWLKTWSEVECKCRAKADQFKEGD